MKAIKRIAEFEFSNRLVIVDFITVPKNSEAGASAEEYH